MTLIFAKFDADLTNISKVTSRKPKWSRFLPHHVHGCLVTEFCYVALARVLGHVHLCSHTKTLSASARRQSCRDGYRGRMHGQFDARAAEDRQRRDVARTEPVDDDRRRRATAQSHRTQGVHQGSADRARGVRHHQVVEDDQPQHDTHRHCHVPQVAAPLPRQWLVGWCLTAFSGHPG